MYQHILLDFFPCINLSPLDSKLRIHYERYFFSSQFFFFYFQRSWHCQWNLNCLGLFIDFFSDENFLGYGSVVEFGKCVLPLWNMRRPWLGILLFLLARDWRKILGADRVILHQKSWSQGEILCRQIGPLKIEPETSESGAWVGPSCCFTT